MVFARARSLSFGCENKLQLGVVSGFYIIIMVARAQKAHLSITHHCGAGANKMTKKQILHSLTEQMTRLYKLHAHYENKGEETMARDAHSRAWAIYWCGRDLLGDSYTLKLDEAQRSARKSGVRFEAMLQEQFDS